MNCWKSLLARPAKKKWKWYF